MAIKTDESYRPPSLDKTGRRNFVYTADVEGPYQKLKRFVHWILILIYLTAPWLHLDGNQLIHLDIPGRRFHFFGLVFWAHDGPLTLFLLAGAALTLAFVTAIWGRVWCGWACPQTVFLDSVFRKIERFFEGKPRERKKRDHAPMNLEKFKVKTLKWAAFIVVSFVITHSFLAYFVGAKNIPQMITSSPFVNPSSFIFISISNFLILFNYAWFREQLCLIVCPYGRFQSVLMDQHSLAVAYDHKRGEPRRAKSIPKDEQGDCVNCGRCVDVCPTGIDIRRGIQMECIACTACVDACDAVMQRFDKPKGLIRYTTLTELEEDRKPRNIRPRTISYGVLITAIALGLVGTLLQRKAIEANFIRAIETPYQVVDQLGAEPMIINHYRMKVHNQDNQDHNIYLLTNKDNDLSSKVNIIHAEKTIVAEKNKSTSINVFFKFPKSILTLGAAKIKVEVYSDLTGKRELLQTEELPIVGPIQ